MRFIFPLLSISFLFTLSLFAEPNIFGRWYTYDDKEKGLKKSTVEIYEQNGKVYGKVIELFNVLPEKGDNPICDKCKGKLKNQQIRGMIILRNLQYNKETKEYSSGIILDPENGKEYDAKIWLDNSSKNKVDFNTLKVRGYLMFFFRTQTWKKVN